MLAKEITEKFGVSSKSVDIETRTACKLFF